MRALTWNLYHGRSPTPTGRSMFDEFAERLAGWEWDVALLQEVPPWWPPQLAAAAGAQQRLVLTSRNFGLPLRRAICDRNPDILKANCGGANAILVRGAIGDHRSVRLTWWPERRVAHGVRLADRWVVNVHSSTGAEARSWRDTLRALDAARAWASGAPLLFGGDVNIRGRPELPGMVRLGGNHVDHLYVDSGTASKVEVLERGPLSDHPPVRVTI
jgi:endonuclease/exonuclease/phosphatase family metal-dependent hydrolase